VNFLFPSLPMWMTTVYWSSKLFYFLIFLKFTPWLLFYFCCLSLGFFTSWLKYYSKESSNEPYLWLFLVLHTLFIVLPRQST
jgi:hypothetical protein